METTRGGRAPLKLDRRPLHAPNIMPAPLDRAVRRCTIAAIAIDRCPTMPPIPTILGMLDFRWTRAAIEIGSFNHLND